METEIIKKIILMVYKSKRECVNCYHFGIEERLYCNGCASHRFTPSNNFIESFAVDILHKLTEDNKK